MYPVSSAGKGTVRVDINADQTQMNVTLSTSGLSGVNFVAINAGRAGEAGPVLFVLLTQSDGSLVSPFSKTLTSDNLQVQTSIGISTFQEAVRAVLSGKAYVSIHTHYYPNGELRGQLGQLTAYATLINSGPRDPSVYRPAPPASAMVQLIADATLSSLSLTLQQIGLTGITGAEIQYSGDAFTLAPGPTLYQVINADFGTNLITATLSASNLIMQPSIGINSYDDFLNALYSGRISVTVKTTTFPDSALSGLIGFHRYKALLTLSGNTPALGDGSVSGLVLGVAGIDLNLLTSDLSTSVSIPDTSLSNITAITLNQGAQGVVGPVVATLFHNITGTVYLRTLSAYLDTLLTISIPDFIVQLRSGNIYVNVTTSANTTSAARGQLLA